MNKVWRVAPSIGSVGAVGAVVFWSLYKDWLHLPIFAQLTPEQTFLLMLTFLGLTFLAVLAMLVVSMPSLSRLGSVSITNTYGISAEQFQHLAEELGVHKTALASFFTILEQQSVPPADLDMTLRAIAAQYKTLLERVRTLSAGDPHIARLRTAAEAAIHAGHFAQAETLLNEASERDVAAAQELHEFTTKRLLSAAEAKAANGTLKRMQLASADAADYYRQAVALVESLPAGHEAPLARYLHDWGLAFYDMRDYAGVTAPWQRALMLYRQLAEQNPPAYLPNVATTLNNLGNLYSNTQRLQEAEQAYHEALTIRRQLAEQNPPAYLPDVAGTLNNLAVLYSDTQRLQEAEQAYHEALTTYRQLAEQNPPAYLPDVAMTLNNLAVLYSDTQRLQEAEQAYHEALTTYRQLAEQNPSAYLPDVAGTLNNLGFLKFQQGYFSHVQTLVDEASTIWRSLWEQHPAAYGNDFARSLAVEILLLQHQEGDQEALISQRLHEMVNVAMSENLKQWAQKRLAEMCPGGQ